MFGGKKQDRERGVAAFIDGGALRRIVLAIDLLVCLHGRPPLPFCLLGRPPF